MATQTQKLVASDAAVDDSFGADVDRAGDTVIVGAAGFTNLTGPKSAGAYVFTLQGSSWVESAKLVGQGVVSGDAFGNVVAIDGDTVAVGAFGDDEGGIVNAGSAFVFVRTATTWTEQAKLIASDLTSNQEFGSAVALEGDTLVVGAQHNAGSAPGRAYVFKRSGTTWSELQKLDRPDPMNDDIYGNRVAIDGDTIAVGAARHSGSASLGGAVYVFRVGTGGLYSLETKLLPNDPVSNGTFGSDVALDGDRAVVGALNAHSGGIATGAAYVFERTGTTWTQVQKLVASNGQLGDLFGIRVSLASTRLLIGSSLDDDKAPDAGSAYLFELDPTGWQQSAKLVASDGSNGDRFGASLTLDANDAVVGAWAHDGYRGAAYVFSVKNTTGVGCSSAAECGSGFCVDGVCCDTACGGGNPDDCQACSQAAGGSVSGTCGPRAESASCDDGDLCTEGDICQSGICGGNALACVATDECHGPGVCDPANGTCSDPALPDGTPCAAGICQSGACVAVDAGSGGTAGAAGTGATGGVSGSGGGEAIDAGPDAGPAPSDAGDDGGCGCRVKDSRSRGARWLLVAFAALALLRARQR